MTKIDIIPSPLASTLPSELERAGRLIVLVPDMEADYIPPMPRSANIVSIVVSANVDLK